MIGGFAKAIIAVGLMIAVYFIFDFIATGLANYQILFTYPLAWMAPIMRAAGILVGIVVFVAILFFSGKGSKNVTLIIGGRK